MESPPGVDRARFAVDCSRRLTSIAHSLLCSLLLLPRSALRSRFASFVRLSMSLPLARLVARAAPAMVARCWMRPAVAVLARPQAPLARCFTAGPTRLTKFSTRIAGLDVVPNGREVLIGLQKEILASIDQYNKALGVSPFVWRAKRRTSERRSCPLGGTPSANSILCSLSLSLSVRARLQRVLSSFRRPPSDGR